MEVNNKITIYISYYLARFNYVGLNNLGYSTWREAFNDISEKLKVNPHSVKNYRDEFDPLFRHRAGWYQRPMRIPIIKIAQALEELDEPEIRSLVLDIISGNIDSQPDNQEILLSIANDSNHHARRLILRNPTGHAAEEYFIKFFHKTIVQ